MLRYHIIIPGGLIHAATPPGSICTTFGELCRKFRAAANPEELTAEKTPHGDQWSIYGTVTNKGRETEWTICASPLSNHRRDPAIDDTELDTDVTDVSGVPEEEKIPGKNDAAELKTDAANVSEVAEGEKITDKTVIEWFYKFDKSAIRLDKRSDLYGSWDGAAFSLKRGNDEVPMRFSVLCEPALLSGQRFPCASRW